MEEIEKMEGDQRALKTELIKLCWFMRGSLTLDDAFHLCVEDRDLIAKLVKENLETTKKTGLPFF